MVEPPGIFRGRGEHPHAGRIKSRIVPEFVTINIGLEAPIPVCTLPGHSWKRIISNKEATWLANFKDERASFTLSKYVMLAAESTVKGENDRLKYEKARRLKVEITKIRKNYHQMLKSESTVDNMLGVCTYLIDRLALRVGNEKGEDEADTVGCCSLRVEHVRFGKKNEITLDFLGKDSMQYLNTVTVEPQVHKHLKSFTVGKKPKDELFDRVNAGRLNDYLKQNMEDLSAKVFRTYNASVTLCEELYKGNIDAESDSTDVKVKFYEDCNRKVALLCNH